MNTEIRDWQPDGSFDRDFLREVPPADLNSFQEAIHPLSDEASAAFQRALFAGIKKPWHYRHTTSWMRRLLHEGFSDRSIDTFDKAVIAIRTRIDWAANARVFMVPQAPNVYTATWGSFLQFFQRGHIRLFENMLVCNPLHRDVVLFWEGYCWPYFGKRGSRRLPCSTWDSEV
ncbi:MAG: hypothetical protein HYX68_03135 [Planctomycetes bacterium]|nr:hypothetical protein [Planctomycetota bacterium]